MMATIEGIHKLLSQVDRLAADARKDSGVTVQVGFTQRYALVVHEDLEAHHNVGQAKFLETPARSMKPTLRRVMRRVLAATGSIEKAMLAAGLRLQRAAQRLTPVDTSALRASAYTALENEANSVAHSAYIKSERIRVDKLESRKAGRERAARKRRGVRRNKRTGRFE